MDYEDMLERDFLNKQGEKYDYCKKQVRIGEIISKLHLYKKFTLTPHSKTIIQTESNQIGIIKKNKAWNIHRKLSHTPSGQYLSGQRNEYNRKHHRNNYTESL